MASAEADSQHQALADALWAVLLPLARLAIARGLPFASTEELLKRAFVQVGRAAQRESAAPRIVSRVSTATGISRREVTRLLALEPRAPAHARSLAAEVFARWTTARRFRDRRGTPRVLPRQGRGATFEALAQSITRDVHPRSLLDELVRLGLARHDAESDTVALQRDTFVPRRDAARMLGFLGDNVGDHLSAAVHNVLADDGSRHFEQAVFADELSAESIEQARTAIRGQWQALIDAMVPMLEQLVERDRVEDRRREQRLRIGLFTYSEVPAAPVIAFEPHGAPSAEGRQVELEGLVGALASE